MFLGSLGLSFLMSLGVWGVLGWALSGASREFEAFLNSEPKPLKSLNFSGV